MLEENKKTQNDAQVPATHTFFGTNKKKHLPSEAMIDWPSMLKRENAKLDFSGPILDTDSVDTGVYNSLESQYKDITQFAEGGFCKIYKAKSRFLERTVAIKSLKSSFASDPEEVRKFVREAKLIAQLNHSGIVSVYDILRDDNGGIHISMKMVNGKNLSELLYKLGAIYREHHIPAFLERKALLSRLTVFLRICETVAYAHHKGIVHCDLKPGNISIAPDGSVYVMDWGSANPIGTERKDQIDGTPRYIDAEAVYGKPISPENDIYALGMILAEVVTLRPGISGIDSRDVVDKACEGDFEVVRHVSRNLKVSKKLVAIIEKARNPESKKRYKSVMDLHNDVQHFMFSEEISAAPDNFFESIFRRLRMHKWVAITSISLTFLLMVSVSAAFFMEKLKAEKIAHLEMNERITIQHRTRAIALDIDSKIQKVASKLRYFTVAFGLAYTEPQSTSIHSGFRHNVQFATDVEFKKSLPFSEFFKKRISLEIPSVFVPESLTDEQTSEIFGRLFDVNRLAMSALIESTEILSEIKSIITWNDAANLFVANGGLIHNLFVKLDNGLCISYPGMYYDSIPTQFSFEEASQLPQSSAQQTRWYGPWQDNLASTSIKGITPILNKDGETIGRCLMNVDFQHIISAILNRIPNVSGHLFRCFILFDEHGRIVFDADTENIKLRLMGNYPVTNQVQGATLLEKITRNTQDSQFKYTYKGHECIADWTELPTLRWKLVQLVETSFTSDSCCTSDITDNGKK